MRSFELNMTEDAVERVYTKDELTTAAGAQVDLWLHRRAMENGSDDGLDDWFRPESELGFRIAEPNTIKRLHGYNMSTKGDLLNDATYLNLSQDKKDLIPEDKVLFLLIGELTTGEVVHTHWTLESTRFAQKVTCDWWDDAEQEILDSWGVDYDDIVD